MSIKGAINNRLERMSKKSTSEISKHMIGMNSQLTTINKNQCEQEDYFKLILEELKILKSDNIKLKASIEGLRDEIKKY